jgi:hypothetical protein
MAKAPAQTEENTAKPEEGEAGRGGQVRVRWDDSRMTNTYANVCNVSSTREEMTLLFGTNQTWHTGQNEVTVQLTDRIILNPYAAKRLSLLLGNVVKEYESRFGELNIQSGSTGAGAQG